MTWELKYKITYWSLISFGIILLLFLIIFNGAYWGINPPKEREGVLSVCLSTFIPSLVAIISFLASTLFRVFTKEDAQRQNEQQYTNGMISFEQYKSNLIHIETFEMEKRKAKAQAALEVAKIKEKIEKKAQDTLKDISNEKQE